MLPRIPLTHVCIMPRHCATSRRRARTINTQKKIKQKLVKNFGQKITFCDTTFKPLRRKLLAILENKPHGSSHTPTKQPRAQRDSVFLIPQKHAKSKFFQLEKIDTFPPRWSTSRDPLPDSARTHLDYITTQLYMPPQSEIHINPTKKWAVENWPNFGQFSHFASEDLNYWARISPTYWKSCVVTSSKRSPNGSGLSATPAFLSFKTWKIGSFLGF